MSAAAQAIKQADEGVGGWLMGVVSGQGSSASQIIVSGVLSVIPGVGQVMDGRDLILGVVALTANPTNAWAWADMAVTLVGLIPGFGDAFKVAFKFIRHGHPLGRVLDAVGPKLRGNVERWLNTADWDGLTRQITQQFQRVIDQFISGLDSWAVRAVLGNDKVGHFLTQLKMVRNKAGAMLGEAVKETRQKTTKLLEQPKPATTHKTGTSSGKPGNAGGKQAVPSSASASGSVSGQKGKTAPPPKIETNNAAKTRQDSQKAPDTHAGKTNKNDKREADKKENKRRWVDGTLAEHISDYYALQRRKFKKINRRGRRVEEHDAPNGRGIDHIWRTPSTKVVVGETKGSLVGALAFLALPEVGGEGNKGSPVAVGDANALTGKNPNGTRMTYERTDKDGNTKTAPARGLSETKTLGTQMSHQWIMLNIPKELYASPKDEAEMVRLAREFRDRDFTNPPWDRWVLMVTKPQMTEHHQSGGNRHRIRQPLLTIPDNVLEY